jgi:hypothetical protein
MVEKEWDLIRKALEVHEERFNELKEHFENSSL